VVRQLPTEQEKLLSRPLAPVYPVISGSLAAQAAADS
jgi:hypothetical protein